MFELPFVFLVKKKFHEYICFYVGKILGKSEEY
jgi:hypothetical protein